MTGMPHWIPAYIGLGSNLDDPASQVRAALAVLRDIPDTRLVASSGLYRNPPMGSAAQPDFVNAVAGLLTRLPPDELLRNLHAIENRMGRVRVPGDRWGPRVIDLDLLVYGSLQRSVPGLNLPHPGIFERNFVLFPLREIAPALQVPGQGVVAAMAARLDKAGMQRLGV